MHIHQRYLWLNLALLTTVFFARADVVEYAVQVDTSSISGTDGSLDFQFNPGPLVSQSALLEVLDFATDGILAGSPILTGDASGLLPGTILFDNGSAFNDYFEGFTFGNTLSFDVLLSGPALISPDGTSTSGSTFAFSMFSDSAGTIPALTSDTTDGFAFTVDVNLDGSTTVTNFSTPTSVIPAPSAVPEPNPAGPSLLLVCGVFFLAARRRRDAPSEGR